jgi:hypothetical protein
MNHLRTHGMLLEDLDNAVSDVVKAGSKRKAEQLTISQLFSSPTGSQQITSTTSSRDRQLHQQVMTVKFVADALLPLNIVERESFRDLIKSYDHKSKPMSTKFLKDQITLIERRMKEYAISTLKGFSICLTVDHWTSKAHQNFTGLTAHFIDDNFNVHLVNLGIYLHEGGTDSDSLEKSFLNLLMNDLNMAGTKIFAVTTDTTANMNSFGRRLESSGIAHIYCTDHVLQCTCRLVYDRDMGATFGDNSESVQKARDLVGFFNKSSQAVEKLKKKQELLDSCPGRPLTVVTDVCTRWWSTHAMIERLLHLKPAIDAMVADNQVGAYGLEQRDWAILKDVMQVLAPFKFCQKQLEGDKYVTCSWVLPAINICRKELSRHSVSEENSVSKTMSLQLLSDFEKCWGRMEDPLFDETVRRARANRQIGIHPALLIAHFLDPRFKQLSQVKDDDAKQSIKNRVLDIMIQSENEFRASVAQHDNNDESAVGDANINEEMELEHNSGDDVDDILKCLENEIATADRATHVHTLQITSVEQKCRDELRQYIAAPSQPLRLPGGTMTFSNPLEWWRQHKDTFPTLARLAKVYLAVQATSAPSERVFSQASKIINNVRSSLHPEMAGKLLFISKNWDWFYEHMTASDLIADEVN